MCDKHIYYAEKVTDPDLLSQSQDKALLEENVLCGSEDETIVCIDFGKTAS